MMLQSQFSQRAHSYLKEMKRKVGLNDVVLVFSLVYSINDIAYEWDSFSTCEQPIHIWLFGSYACLLAFRLAQLVGDSFNGGSRSDAVNGVAAEFLLDLRHKSSAARWLAAFSWFVNLPFFIFWTLVGTFWLRDVARSTPSCVPSPSHVWYTVAWLLLSYVWIFIHIGIGVVAWRLELRVRRAEQNLRAVEDDDVRSRWGGVSSLGGYDALPMGPVNAGLTPAEIQKLPHFYYRPPSCEHFAGGEPCPCDHRAGDHLECAICLNDFSANDGLRKLPGCGHTFHRACIDLWLLRCAECPLCKSSVHKMISEDELQV